MIVNAASIGSIVRSTAVEVETKTAAAELVPAVLVGSDDLDEILEEIVRLRKQKIVSSGNDHCVSSSSSTSYPSVEDEVPNKDEA